MSSDVQVSKTLSYWLRHRPDAAGVSLSSEGWADIDVILAAFWREQIPVDWEGLLKVVESSDKARFEISADGAQIRARQGHSINVNAGWEKAAPPETLYHGTVERFAALIQEGGLLRMQRHHVHLSADIDTAKRVGSRRGSPIIFVVHAGKLASTGTDFFLTANGVWLVEHVPPDYLELI